MWEKHEKIYYVNKTTTNMEFNKILPVLMT